MKKGGAALAGPIWNGVISAALKNLPRESFDAPDPIDQSLPPILRGFWQGGETFVTDKVSGKLATEFTPVDMRQETSLTNVHTILHWINKDNPLGPKPTNPQKDSQYASWENGVQNWWASNKNRYPTITTSHIPVGYDTIHTESSRPTFTISGVTNEVYKKNQTISVSVLSQSKSSIKKIDVFVNNTYITSIKNEPYVFSFTPSSISSLGQTNTIKVIGYDSLGNKGETSIQFFVENN